MKAETKAREIVRKHLFVHFQPQEMRPNDMELQCYHDIAAALEEAYEAGRREEREALRRVRCQQCGGNGAIPEESTEGYTGREMVCPNCNGSGAT